MILYFSGTGNSQYVAHIISKEIHDDVLNLFDKIRTQDYTALKSSKPWIIVAPTYAWRIPRIVNEWLKKTPFSNLSLRLNALNLFNISAKELKGQDPSQAGFAKPNLSVRPSYTFQFNVTF